MSEQYTLIKASSSKVGGTYRRNLTGDAIIELEITGDGALTASVDIEASNNGRTWQAIKTISLSGVNTAKGNHKVSEPWKFIRANVKSIAGDNAEIEVVQNSIETISSGGGGGGTGADLPDPYKWELKDGRLELNKSTTKLMAIDENGAEIANSVKTGVGSFHLGDVHSIGSANENVIFVNDASNVAWFPAWQGISKDGATVYNPTVQTFGALTSSEPSGAVGTGFVDYVDSITSGADVAYFKIEFVPHENYKGGLVWVATRTPENKEVASFIVDVDLKSGDRYTLNFEYPLFVKIGQSFTVSLRKGYGGDFLKVKNGATASSTPYRKVWIRPTTNSSLAASNGWSISRVITSDSFGSLKDSTVTTTELENIAGSKARNTTATIVDTDGFVFNSNGSMMQVAASRVWNYISTKLNGAISTVWNTNLTANTFVVSSSTGKIANATAIAANRLVVTDAGGLPSGNSAITASRALVSNASGLPVAATTTTDEINALAGGAAKDTSMSVEGTDGLIINDAGVIKQTTWDRVRAYILGSIGGAIQPVVTNDLTQHRILISDSNGKIVASSHSSSLTRTKFTYSQRFTRNPAGASGKGYYIQVNAGSDAANLNGFGVNLFIGVTGATDITQNYTGIQFAHNTNANLSHCLCAILGTTPQNASMLNQTSPYFIPVMSNPTTTPTSTNNGTAWGTVYLTNTPSTYVHFRVAIFPTSTTDGYIMAEVWI